MKDIHIERLLKVSDGEKIWEFYQKTFQDTNENTPIAQIFPKEFFWDWLSNERVIKFIVKDETDEIHGIGFITDQIRLDWLLSPQYFEKHYPHAKVYQCPVIAVAKHRHRLQVVSMLVKNMFDEMPDDAYGVFLYSKTHNSFLPRLFKHLQKDYPVSGHDIDSEACLMFTKDVIKNPIPITVKPLRTGTSIGKHLTIDGYLGVHQKLDDRDLIYQCLNNLPELLGMQKLMAPIVNKCAVGWSGYVWLFDGHINLYSFPKSGLINFDIYTYGNDINSDLILHYLTINFGLGDVEANLLTRGLNHS